MQLGLLLLALSFAFLFVSISEGSSLTRHFHERSSQDGVSKKRGSDGSGSHVPHSPHSDESLLLHNTNHTLLSDSASETEAMEKVEAHHRRKRAILEEITLVSGLMAIDSYFGDMAIAYNEEKRRDEQRTKINLVISQIENQEGKVDLNKTQSDNQEGKVDFNNTQLPNQELKLQRIYSDLINEFNALDLKIENLYSHFGSIMKNQDLTRATVLYGKDISRLRFFHHYLSNDLGLTNLNVNTAGDVTFVNITYIPTERDNEWADEVLSLGLGGTPQILHNMHDMMMGHHSLQNKPIFAILEGRLNAHSENYKTDIAEIKDFFFSVQLSGYLCWGVALLIRGRSSELEDVKNKALTRAEMQKDLLKKLLAATPQPQVSTTQPMASTPGPEISSQKAIMSTLRPVSSSPKATASSPRPVISTHEYIDFTARPEISTEESIDITTGSVISTEESESVNIRPVITTEESIDLTTSPVISTRESIDLTTRPVISTQESVASTARPVISTQESIDLTTRPVISTQESVTSTARPVISTQESIDLTTSPVISTRESIDLTTSPVISTRESIDLTTRPVISTQESVASTARPVISTQESVASTASPVISTQESIYLTTRPVISTQESTARPVTLTSRAGVSASTPADPEYFVHGNVFCVFPFIYSRKLYHQCTTEYSGRKWCATTDNYDRDGNWEYCTVPPDVVPTSRTRLVNGPNSHSGRVEVYYQGHWGTVCDDDFTDNAASVVCRSLGFAPGRRQSFGPGTNRIWLDSVNCTGSEAWVGGCSHNRWGQHDCRHAEDVGVICRSVSSVRTRLVNGTSSKTGRVEVYHQGQWGTVCDDNFSDTAASVVCRSLGYSAGIMTRQQSFGPGTNLIWLDSVNCDGSEEWVGDCSHRPWGRHDCSHREDVGVICRSESAVRTRLVNGRNSRSGRVEVYYRGQWGTVCDDHFTDNAASVVCRSLGYAAGVVVTGQQPFGRGTNQIWLDDVRCSGSEEWVGDCSRNSWAQHDCSHREDVGVICRHVSEVRTRLVNGTDSRSGRVEVNYQGQWGTVCDDYFSNYAASVVCRSLGFLHGVVSRQMAFGAGTNQILLDHVSCLGSEEWVGDCYHRPWGHHTCNHGEDVGVICS